jgi:hypothetical protein
VVGSMEKYWCILGFIIQWKKHSYFYMDLIDLQVHCKFCIVVASMPLDMMLLSFLMQKEPVFFSVVPVFVMPGRSWAFSAVPEIHCFVFALWAWKAVIFKKKKIRGKKDIFYYFESYYGEVALYYNLKINLNYMYITKYILVSIQLKAILYSTK